MAGGERNTKGQPNKQQKAGNAPKKPDNMGTGKTSPHTLNKPPNAGDHKGTRETSR
ncbi:hypothetical protein G97194_004747 [Escherichia coli]|nr:hypothetical protein G97194_004747 [Escherichia coli]